MIQIEQLGKTYGPRSRPVAALREVSLTLEPGVWGVVGPNGAGKTTLLGLVLGFLKPSTGEILVAGDRPRDYVRRHGAAYLPERFRLPDPWPVRSALRSLARLEGTRDGGADADRRTDAALERLGLESHADRPVGTLSRGLNQRVGLAQALLADRRLVVLDEPTEGLDPLWRVRFREIVDDLRGDRTVLIASHELAEVERLTDRVVLLDDGRVTDLLESRPLRTGPLRYRLTVEGSREAVGSAFPNTSEAGDGQYTVTVADAAELSDRLAALLESGVVVHAVVPEGEDLETRVRQRLGDRPQEPPGDVQEPAGRAPEPRRDG